MTFESIPPLFVYIMFYSFWLSPFAFCLSFLKTVQRIYSEESSWHYVITTCFSTLWLICSGVFLFALYADREFSVTLHSNILNLFGIIATYTAALSPIAFILSLLHSVKKVLHEEAWLVSGLVAGFCLLWLLFSTTALIFFASMSAWQPLPT